MLFDFAVVGTVLKVQCALARIWKCSFVTVRCRVSIAYAVAQSPSVCLSVCPFVSHKPVLYSSGCIHHQTWWYRGCSHAKDVGENPTAFFPTPPLLTQAHYSIYVLNVLLNTIYPTIVLCIRLYSGHDLVLYPYCYFCLCCMHVPHWQVFVITRVFLVR